MREIQRLKEQILRDYPRLNQDSAFQFRCHPGVPCFNDCCGDINIFLTPYDVIRLKHNLGITSNEFLNKYAIMPFDKNLKYPVVLLKMNDDEKKSCPFVTDKGCGVYPDRPWACRMYPLGLASPKEGYEELDEEFYFLLEEEFCKGFKEDHKYTVSDWIKDQGIEEYNQHGEDFKNLTLHEFFVEHKNLTPDKIDMFHTVCYNIDKFRDMLFKSSFFDKFEVDQETRENIKNDDIALLKFGYRWLRFSLFGEDTMTIRQDILDKKKSELKTKLDKDKGEN